MSEAGYLPAAQQYPSVPGAAVHLSVSVLPVPGVVFPVPVQDRKRHQEPELPVQCSRGLPVQQWFHLHMPSTSP